MRKALAFFVFAGALILSGPVYAYRSPGTPAGYVNDFAHVMSTEVAQNLETKLKTYAANTSGEIAVVTVPDLGGDYIENFAVKLFEEWKIGSSKRDNGVLLLVARDDHKLRIEVGYGLEGALPDSLAQQIIDKELTPKLQSGDFDGAITAGTEAIIEATKGEYRAESSNAFNSAIADNFPWIAIVIVFGFQWLVAVLGRSKSWWAGGIIGVFAGMGVGWYFGLAFGISVFVASILGVCGLLLDYVVSTTYKTYAGRGGTPPWWTGGGSGGRSGGGGFGGFGGGSSGGGGASGRW